MSQSAAVQTGSDTSKDSVKLTDGNSGKDYAFEVRPASLGPSVIDIRKLYADTDMFTYDPGFTSPASCESKITFIDGDQGILLHRAIRSSNWRKIPIFSSYAICCWKASCRTVSKSRSSRTTSPITRWCMNRFTISSVGSAGMLTRWR